MMWKTFCLGILWTASISVLVSESAVINCLDGRPCKNVRVIVQDPRSTNEIIEVSQNHPTADHVDFHGSLLEEYEHPSRVQWKKLNLSYNSLTQDVFQNINNNWLQVVDLTYNKLGTVSVPSSVIDFIAERCQLHGISIKPQNQVRRMVLPKNQFDSLSKFTSMRNLEELDLSCNDLSELKIDQLPASLKILKLARNHIHSISGPKSFQLQRLEYLDLSNNILTTVLDSHAFFPYVKNLNLQNNKIVMWMDDDKISNQLERVDLLNNDWDCNNLQKVVNKITIGKLVKGQPSSESNCRQDRAFICCTQADSPYADRLIKYRKKEFKALQEGTAVRETGNLSCSKYEPNPCEGDDGLVLKVAGSAVSLAKSFQESSLQELEVSLTQSKNIVKQLDQDVKTFQGELNKLNAEHSDLVAYIMKTYTETVPESSQIPNGGPRNAVKQLQDLFEYYESNNEDLKKKINEEERNNQDKLDEVQTLEKEMEELNYRRDKLTEDVNNRNATVNDYKSKIENLKARLGQV